MYRGTTPTVRYKIKQDQIKFDEIDQVRMTFRSLAHTLTKDLTEIILDSNEQTISYTFSQEETLDFNSGPVEIQLRILLKNGTAMATPIVRRNFNQILDNSVIE